MEPPKPPPLTLLVCVNRRFDRDRPSCAGRGSGKLLKALEPKLTALDPPIKVMPAPCQGRCSRGIVLRLLPSGRLSLDNEPHQTAAVIARLLTPFDKD
jgi:hypothetical protein